MKRGCTHCENFYHVVKILHQSGFTIHTTSRSSSSNNFDLWMCEAFYNRHYFVFVSFLLQYCLINTPIRIATICLPSDYVLIRMNLFGQISIYFTYCSSNAPFVLIGSVKGSSKEILCKELNWYFISLLNNKNNFACIKLRKMQPFPPNILVSKFSVNEQFLQIFGSESHNDFSRT